MGQTKNVKKVGSLKGNITYRVKRISLWAPWAAGLLYWTKVIETKQLPKIKNPSKYKNVILIYTKMNSGNISGLRCYYESKE